MRDFPVLAAILFHLISAGFTEAQNSEDKQVFNPADSLYLAKSELPAGILSGKFEKENGPYLLKGSAVVPSGHVLQFAPGCTVFVGGQYTTITVFGQMIAQGSEKDPVVFMSARKVPNPWDWDRIYCRSKNRSVFQHCILRHSNFGIFVENGSAEIRNCRFERNSLHGIAVKNSEVSISECVFSKGHILALNLQPGADVTADSLIITENVTGIACQNNASLTLTRGSISGNANGLVLAGRSAVSIVGANVTKNKNGIIATEEIPKRMREMVYNNTVDVKVSNEDEILSVIKDPEAVRSVILPQTSQVITAKEGFTPGFSALSAPREPTASFIGNVTGGFSYFAPRSLRHPIEDSASQQTHYPEGIQPEIQVFASGRRGAADVNLLMDLYGNNWLSTQGYVGKNMFNLSMTFLQQAFALGDFFESGSETSISGRQLTGLRYTGNYWDMGAGNRRIEFKLAAGESEIPKDSGDHEINIYNDVVDSGMSVRQQITYLASLSIKPTLNSVFTARGIISRDQTFKPLFRNQISDPGAPKPIQAQTGVLEGSIDMMGGKLKLYTEIDLGIHDTISEEKTDEIAWYNPKVEEAVPKVFRLMGSRDEFLNHYAFTLGAKSSLQGYNFDLSGMQISKNYFSAGNPYLESDRRTAVINVDKQFRENLSATAGYIYERTMISTDPLDRNTLNIRGEYQMGENKPAFTADYTTRYETTTAAERIEVDSNTYSARYVDKAWNNLIGLEGKQSFQNGIFYSLRYQFLWDNDISNHADEAQQDEGDQFQHTLNGSFSFKLKKYLKNKTTFRVALNNENRDSLHAVAGRLNDQLTLTIIPRKLSLNLAGEYNYKREKEYSREESKWEAPVYTRFYGGELETRYSLNSRLSVSVKGRYEKSYDELEGSRENYSAAIGSLHLTYLF